MPAIQPSQRPFFDEVHELQAYVTRTVSGISIFSHGEYQSLCGVPVGVPVPVEGAANFRSDPLDPLPEAESLPGGVGDSASYEVFTQLPAEVVQSLEEHWSGVTAMPEIVGT